MAAAAAFALLVTAWAAAMTTAMVGLILAATGELTAEFAP
jgi:hypothetical protein